jgi:protein TonB
VAPLSTKVALPSSDADYLHNPTPEYPALSKRRGEQGRVVLRVLIGADGVAQKAEVHQTSGFERLDQAGLNTVLRWRYAPGKRGGLPEAMWFHVPINFVME